MKTKEYRITQFIAHFVCILGVILVLFPFVLMIVASFTDNTWATANGFSLFPKAWSIDAYKYIWLEKSTIGRAYVMTIIVTAAGTAISIIITTLFAYALCQDHIPAMKVFGFMLIFTMLFNGGLVATYYSYVNIFHMRNTIWALIFPGLCMSAFNVILVRNYFKTSIPPSLIEAAYLDGAGEFKTFIRVVMPLSKPIVATIGLMTGLAYWNDWQNGLYYLTPRGGSGLYTIQVVLNNINENIQLLQQNASKMAGLNISLPSTTIRMAIAFVGILPILLIYPYFQKYFIKGITLGGVKG